MPDRVRPKLRQGLLLRLSIGVCVKIIRFFMLLRKKMSLFVFNMSLFYFCLYLCVKYVTFFTLLHKMCHFIAPIMPLYCSIMPLFVQGKSCHFLAWLAARHATFASIMHPATLVLKSDIVLFFFDDCASAKFDLAHWTPARNPHSNPMSSSGSNESILAI